MFTWLISETLLTVFSVRDQPWISETIQTATHWDNSKPLGQTNLLYLQTFRRGSRFLRTDLLTLLKITEYYAITSLISCFQLTLQSSQHPNN